MIQSPIRIAPKYKEMARLWAPSVATFGAAAGLLGLWITDWKVIVTRIPFYGSKFPKQE